MNIPKECAYEEALLSKRIEFVKSLQYKLEADRSIAGQVTAAYSCLLDEVLTEVIQEVHREVKTGVAQHQKLEAPEKASDAQAGLSPKPMVRGVKGAIDVFGQTAQNIMNEEVSCSNCGRRIAASRFAPHLEKCLGRGRNASRAGSRRNF